MGETRLFFDGDPVTPYMRQDGSVLEIMSPSAGGADPHIAAGTLRRSKGVLQQSCQRICCKKHCFLCSPVPVEDARLGKSVHNIAAALLQQFLPRESLSWHCCRLQVAPTCSSGRPMGGRQHQGHEASRAGLRSPCHSSSIKLSPWLLLA